MKLNRFESEVKVHIFLTVFLLFLLSNFSFAAKQFPVEANILWERNFTYVAPVDLNNDSIKELIVIMGNSGVQTFSQELRAYEASIYLDKRTFDESSTCGGLDSKNLWVTYVRRDSIFLCDLLSRKEMFVTNGYDIDSRKGWNGYAEQVELCDLNTDGRLEAIVSVCVGFDLKPRGIFVLDWATGKSLWKFLCGPVPTAFLLKDIDRDGKTEILFGTGAPNNGNMVNETDDMHTYVFLLNFEGKIRWFKQIGLHSSKVEVSWLNDSESKIFACEVGNPAGGRKQDSIFVLNAFNGQVLIRRQYGEFNSGHAIVHNAKGQELIVVAGSDDTLRLLNNKLNLVRKRAINGGGCMYISSGNFTDKKHGQIVVQTNNGYISLYDLNLKLLGKFNSGVVDEMRPIISKDKSRLLLSTWIQGQRNWRLVEFNTIPSILNRALTIGTVIYIGLILIFVFGMTLIYTRYRQTRDIRTVIRRLTGNAGVIELNRKGEIISTNSKSREIIGKLDGTIEKLPTTGPLAPITESAKTMAKEPETATVQETVVSLSPEQTYLVRCVPVKRGALLTFEDISAVEYLKRVTTWAPVAQKLAHGIKNPLATILGAVEQMDVKCEEEGIKRYIGLVKEEVLKLKKMSDAFMKFTKLSPPVLQTKNINELIKSVMTRYEPLCEGAGRREQGAGIKVDYELDENLPLVPIDEEGIINVLNIIIENGIEAMSPSPYLPHQGGGEREDPSIKREGKKGEGFLRIKTGTMEKFEKEAEKIKKYLKIEIADTGVGIQEKYLNKVFDPYFTYNKPFGTGLGLTLAKKIVESHNGFIEIISKEGVGTTVSVYLPLSQNV